MEGLTDLSWLESHFYLSRGTGGLSVQESYLAEVYPATSLPKRTKTVNLGCLSFPLPKWNVSIVIITRIQAAFIAVCYKEFHKYGLISWHLTVQAGWLHLTAKWQQWATAMANNANGRNWAQFQKLRLTNSLGNSTINLNKVHIFGPIILLLGFYPKEITQNTEEFFAQGCSTKHLKG